jgi:hypothetical protein
MADNLVYEESLNTETDQSEFISKKWVYVNDNNAQNYTSQVVIDSTPLSNAGGWINWSEGFILMPLVVQLSSAALTLDTNVANYSWAFKSGFWQMISSMTVEFNNQNIIQQTPFLNVFRSFKANTSFSQDDLLNEGASIGFFPDSASSWSYYNSTATITPSSTLNGRCNNLPFANNQNTLTPVGAAWVGATAANNLSWGATEVAGIPEAAVNTVTYTGSTSQPSANFGMFQRQKYNNYVANNAIGAASLQSGQNLINAVANCNTVYRSSLVTSAAGNYSWNTYAKLRLKDLADYFEKCPLLKGSTIRFYINTNQSSVDFTIGANPVITASGGITTNRTLAVNSVVVTGGTTCPLMLASASLGQGSSPLPAGNYTLSVAIYKNSFATVGGVTAAQSQLSSCRLYAPVYYMNPLAESRYLSLAPTKKILYKDIFQYQFSNIQTGSFNFLVSNGIANICSVLVVPFISTSNQVTTGAGTSNIKYPSYLSPVCSSPASPDPIMLTNFNILVSGVNLFLNNENYDFEAFREQLLQSNQINGSLTTGLASGLIGENEFTNLYRYYYGDASRILPSEQGVSRSVQIVGQNASIVGCDIMVFVEFMREMTIDISTGARIE